MGPTDDVNSDAVLDSVRREVLRQRTWSITTQFGEPSPDKVPGSVSLPMTSAGTGSRLRAVDVVLIAGPTFRSVNWGRRNAGLGVR